MLQEVIERDHQAARNEKCAANAVTAKAQTLSSPALVEVVAGLRSRVLNTNRSRTPSGTSL